MSSTQTFNFSTLYTTIPREKFKTSLLEIIHHAIYFTNGSQGYKFIVLGHKLTYYVKHKIKKCFIENELISILEFLISNIFVEFRGHIHKFQQIVGISMGTNYALSLSIFFYSPVRQSLCNTWSKTKKIKKLILRFSILFGTVPTVVFLFFILVEG